MQGREHITIPDRTTGEIPAPNAVILSAPAHLALRGESAALQFQFTENTIPSVAPNQRKGRKMSRSCGQCGSIEQKGDWWHLRYWADTVKGRSHRSQPICLAVGKGKKTKSEARRLGKEWLVKQGINSEEHLEKAVGPMLGFREQSEAWLHKLRTRNRRPIPDSSVPSIRSALDCWLLPYFGDMPLNEVNNNALRGLVKKMIGTLSAKTINTYTTMAKEIVESLLDEDGEPIYARKWNSDLSSRSKGVLTT